MENDISGKVVEMASWVHNFVIWALIQYKDVLLPV